MAKKKEVKDVGMLSLESVSQAQAFVGAPVKREISWKQVGEDGKPVEYSAYVFVRQRSCETLERDTMAAIEKRDIFASRIATLICDEKGDPVFSYEDAARLREPLALALSNAIGEVNGAKK